MNEPDGLTRSDLPAAHIARFEELMAQELHDTVCQGLAGTIFLVNVLRRQAEAGRPVKTEDLQKVASFLEQTMDDLRATISAESLAGVGLSMALEKFAREVSRNVPCRVSPTGAPGPDDPRTALVLYRLTRWAVRHAMRSVETIFIDLDRADGFFSLEIHDGSTAVFQQLPEAEISFLTQYALTAGVELQVDTDRRRLRARAPQA